jgi:hypothetical protein
MSEPINKNFIDLLLAITDKSGIEKFCKSHKVNLFELQKIIIEMKEKGYCHEVLQFEWQSQNIQLSEKNKSELSDKTKKPLKTLAKLIKAFDHSERIIYFAHLFTKGTDFYCIWFTTSSMNGAEKGEFWGSKSHVHLLTHHFGNQHTAQGIKEIFDKKTKDALKGEHLSIIR